MDYVISILPQCDICIYVGADQRVHIHIYNKYVLMPKTATGCRGGRRLSIIFRTVNTLTSMVSRIRYLVIPSHFPGKVTRTPARDYRSVPTCLIMLLGLSSRPWTERSWFSTV